jgi:hypothetical protein
VASGTTASITATTLGGDGEADVTQWGGVGGAGGGAAHGGAGGASVLTNAVSGSTNGGILTLNQTARGGAGGISGTGEGGAGGDASSLLTISDSTSAVVNGTAEADGGTGGDVFGGPSGSGGNGGAATASITATGAQIVNTDAFAIGGNGGTAPGANHAIGGPATAIATGIGLTVNSFALANGGSGVGGGGTATATAAGTGQSVGVRGEAGSALGSGVVVPDLTAKVSDGGSGTISVTAETLYSGPRPGFTSGPQAVAYGLGAPSPSFLQAATARDPNVQAALGANPKPIAMGELGGGYSIDGTGQQMAAASILLELNTYRLDPSHHLMLGLIGGRAVGAGVSEVQVAVAGFNGALLSGSFSSASSAGTYFNDHPIDLGPVSALPLYPGMVPLNLSMTVISNSANSGFYGAFVLSA